MGNAPATRLVIWQLTQDREAGRRFSLSGNYLCLYHSVVNGKRLIKVNEEEKHKSMKPFDNGSTHEIIHGGVKYTVQISAKIMGGFTYSCTVNGKKVRRAWLLACFLLFLMEIRSAPRPQLTRKSRPVRLSFAAPIAPRAAFGRSRGLGVQGDGGRGRGEHGSEVRSEIAPSQLACCLLD